MERYRKMRELQKEVEKLQRIIDKFNEKKFSTMKEVAAKKLEQEKLQLQRRQIELALKDKEYDKKRELEHDKAKYRKQSKKLDQTLKDLSFARRQREHHRRIQEYLQENPTPQTRMLLRDGQFPLLHQPVDLEGPGLGQGQGQGRANLGTALEAATHACAAAAMAAAGHRVGRALLPANSGRRRKKKTPPTSKPTKRAKQFRLPSVSQATTPTSVSTPIPAQALALVPEKI